MEGCICESSLKELNLPPVVALPPSLYSVAAAGPLSVEGTQGPIKTAVTRAPSDKTDMPNISLVVMAGLFFFLFFLCYY